MHRHFDVPFIFCACEPSALAIPTLSYESKILLHPKIPKAGGLTNYAVTLLCIE